jgi:hypothetical protein
MSRKKNLPTAQETSFDVSWAFFSFTPPSFPCFPFFPSSLRLPVTSSRLVRCHSIWLGGGVGVGVGCLAALQLYLFPPREQLLAAVVLGPGVVAVSGVVVVLRLRRRYNADKTYYEEKLVS